MWDRLLSAGVAVVRVDDRNAIGCGINYSSTQPVEVYRATSGCFPSDITVAVDSQDMVVTSH